LREQTTEDRVQLRDFVTRGTAIVCLFVCLFNDLYLVALVSTRSFIKHSALSFPTKRYSVDIVSKNLQAKIFVYFTSGTLV